MSISPSNAQDLSSHQWKDRLIIIQSNDPSSQLFKNQILELKNQQKGLEERRLKVYQFLPGKYKRGIGTDTKWENSEKVSKKLLEKDSEFEIILMGLDGGVKLRKNELLKSNEIFGVIDQMPMRQSEMRRKKDG